MDKKNILRLTLCHIIWGTAALYWNLFPTFGAVYKVACRVVFSAVFGVICLAVTKRLHTVKDAFLDKSRIKYIILSSVSIGANWLVYVWALTNGHVVDASLGNFLNPIAISVFGMLFMKEKADPLQIAAISIAAAGFIVSAIGYGSFPFVGVMMMLTFTAYTLFKKKAHTEGVTAFTLETGLISPIALAYMLIFCRGEGGFGSINTVWTALLIISTGVYTSVPFMLYASGVNNFSAVFVGLSNMFAPTVTLLMGILFFKERVTGASLVNMICVLIAIVLFVISTVCNARKKVQTV